MCYVFPSVIDLRFLILVDMFWVSPPFSVAKRKPGYLYGWQQKCVIVMTTAKLGRHKLKKIEAAAVELRP